MISGCTVVDNSLLGEGTGIMDPRRSEFKSIPTWQRSNCLGKHHLHELTTNSTGQ